MACSIYYYANNLAFATIEKREKKDRVVTLGAIAKLEVLGSLLLIMTLIVIMRLSGGRFSKLVTKGVTLGVLLLALNVGCSAAIVGMSCGELDNLESRRY